ncbi:ATP-binding protein [Streptomyces collinus]|uniref:Response regulator receiver n=1 Tax=Streptomyces collinus (strain DSM 40733 / Tue 365) TaxID=1214242 RepID=S5VCY8_STRC3|nr:ATP-binding protein [Streptomyces collinus]AGS73079.1 response regulator receiver [Streptomyces collinus Tu 365]UJA11743.1 ATP-binding protein [Streptomyces collinus]UJA13391.1 ATP-binding protein [Streptomyces collinus]
MAAQLDTLLPETCEQVWMTPPVPGAVSDVRRGVGAVLAEWDVSPEIVEDSLLVVSELLTNAVIHALPPALLRLSWVRGEGVRTLHVEVTDAGPTLPAGHSRVGIDPDEHGRGEEIVHALATRHGIRVHAGGYTRWADLETV